MSKRQKREDAHEIACATESTTGMQRIRPKFANDLQRRMAAQMMRPEDLTIAECYSAAVAHLRQLTEGILQNSLTPEAHERNKQVMREAIVHVLFDTLDHTERKQ